MEDHKKVFSIQIPIEVKVEVVKTSFRGRHGSSHGGHNQHEGEPHGGGQGNFGGRGSRGIRGGRSGSHRSQQPNNDSNYYYYGKHGHMAKNCYQGEHDARNGKL